MQLGFVAPERSSGRVSLSIGADLDDETSLVNPLFGAIYEQSEPIVRMLLENGMNSEVRYNSDTMIDMDALAFALERGEANLAKIIAFHNANNDKQLAKKLLIKARAIMKKNNA